MKKILILSLVSTLFTFFVLLGKYETKVYFDQLDFKINKYLLESFLYIGVTYLSLFILSLCIKLNNFTKPGLLAFVSLGLFIGVIVGLISTLITLAVPENILFNFIFLISIFLGFAIGYQFEYDSPDLVDKEE